jgi:hypothetical protein
MLYLGISGYSEIETIPLHPIRYQKIIQPFTNKEQKSIPEFGRQEYNNATGG